ncbi:MAG TPA: hypothetical protein VFP19_04270 [Candidatus Limnocylindrales bacterium]|nr:hypothetical protein [Candidatus Limnocylindrales bacterium]
MKPTLLLAMVAVLGFAVAGCGATKKATVTVGGPMKHATTETVDSIASSDGMTTAHQFIVAGSVTIRNVKTGTQVACKGWHAQGVRVPPRGQAVFASAMAIPGKKSQALDQMSLRHRRDGSIAVSCTPSK